MRHVTPRLRGEQPLVLLAVVVALAVRVTYVVLTRDHGLVGDEIAYDEAARFAADGRFLWGTIPYGEPQPSAGKAPGYPAFLGLLYLVTSNGPDRSLLLQVLLCAPLVVVATWRLGRRLFRPGVGVASAWVVAVYPMAWQYEVRLYSESLTTPLTTATLLLVLGVVAGADRLRPDLRWCLAVGGLLGVGLLLRPSSLLLLPAIGVVLWAGTGLRRAVPRLLLVTAVGVALVVPWSLRNATLPGPWVPLSVQTAAPFGVFNDDAASDAEFRWKWRPLPTRDRDLFAEPRTEGELLRELNSRTAEYVRENPGSVPAAFWANGVRRTFDLRTPASAMVDVPFEGRTRGVALAGLWAYYAVALLAVAGLVRAWRRGHRALVGAVAALALASAVVYTGDGGTRYRAPLEPLLVVLAVSALDRRRAADS